MFVYLFYTTPTKMFSIYTTPFKEVFCYATPQQNIYFLCHTLLKLFENTTPHQNNDLLLAIASCRAEVFGEDIFIRQQYVHTSVICDAIILFGPYPKMKKSNLVNLYDISAHRNFNLHFNFNFMRSFFWPLCKCF